MARKFLTSIDLNLSELQNAVVQNLASDPTTGNKDGRIYYNTASDELRVYADGVWTAVGSGDINNVVGTANEVDVVVADGTATISLPTTINANTTGSAATLTTPRAIALTGDVTGTANFDGSAGIEISATIAANSVALGTDTTGDYVATISGTDGVSVSGSGTEGRAATVSNTDKGSSQNIFKNVAVAGQSTVVADSNDDTLTIASGDGITITTNATTDTVTVANSGILSVSGTTNQITAGTASGAVTLSLPSAVTFPGTVTLNADPTQALQAATKQYVDAVAEGLHVHASVATATTANISDLSDPPAAIDGVTLTDGMRVLVKDQSTPSQNGIYVYDLDTTALVRASDYDTAAEIQAGDFVFVSGGSIYAASGWVQENNVTTLGTDPIVWTQFSGAGTFTAGNGLTLTGTVFSINTSITADLSTAQTLTNKTLTSPVVSGLYLSDSSIVIEGTANDHETTLSFTDPTQDNTITFKNATGTVAFTADITSAIDALSTTDIEEGTNLYFTDERAQDAVGLNLSGSNSLAATYNDTAGTFTFDTTLATTSYLSKTSGLAVDISSLESKLVTDSFTKKYSASVGNGTNTSYDVTHSLNSRDVVVNVYDNATYDTVEVDVVRTDANTVTVSFSTAPTTNAYRVVVVG
jgi:hypothetical protein